MTVQLCDTADEAVAGIEDGSTVLVGGFGMAGMPVALIDALIRQGATDLTVVSNNAGNGDTGLAALLAKGRVRQVVCSFPRQSDSYVFDELYRAGRWSRTDQCDWSYVPFLGRSWSRNGPGASQALMVVRGITARWSSAPVRRRVRSSRGVTRRRRPGSGSPRPEVHGGGSCAGAWCGPTSRAGGLWPRP